MRFCRQPLGVWRHHHLKKEGGSFTEAFGIASDHPCNIKAKESLIGRGRAFALAEFRNDGE